MRSKGLPLSVVFCIMQVAGCSASLFVPDSRDAADETSLKELMQGRGLYVQKCGTCHTLFLPHRFPEAEWRRTLDRMQPRARIDHDQKLLIMKYILAGRARQSSND